MGNSIQAIVQDYLHSTRYSLRDFGSQFGVSHTTMMYWRDGKFSPETDLMMQFRNYPDWRGAFAREILSAKGIY